MKIRCSYKKLVPIDELKPHPQNANDHPAAQIRQLATILEYQGWRAPIRISLLSGFITAGHGRLLAAKLNGWKEVPVDFQEYESHAQEFADVQADNAIALQAELDVGRIKTLYNVHRKELAPHLLGLAKFEPTPLENERVGFGGGSGPGGDEEDQGTDDKIPGLPLEVRIRAGDAFSLGKSWLRCGDCLQALAEISDNSVDALVSDPPAGISFMGKEWDDDKGGRDKWIQWLASVMRECYRVLKPGAHGLVWAIPRTSHWTGTALESAGFEVRDVITHLFGQGFPKSHDVSKAIDRANCDERPVIEKKTGAKPGMHGGSGSYGHGENRDITSAASAASAAWEGWGTALKPASEHWILVRKPLDGTIAENVLKWGTGGINIDACRIGFDPAAQAAQAAQAAGVLHLQHSDRQVTKVGGAKPGDTIEMYKPGGRFPANLTLDEEAAAMLDAQSGTLKSGSRAAGVRKGLGFHGADGDGGPELVGNSGGASRFFYVAKASSSEKNQGLDSLPTKQTTGGGGMNQDCASAYGSVKAPAKNFHPTVKPLSLMRYLIKLITPPGGVVVEPFGGSGTTLVAAHKLGFECLISELNPEYCHIIIERWQVAANAEAVRADGKKWSEVKG